MCRSSTWYPAALANKISNSDLSAASDDIGATFNSSVDTGCLGAGTRFYYGFDNATPAGTINLLVVVLHELGHGLGFLTFTDEATGAYFNGQPDAWARLMFDRDQNVTWFQMTQAQRATSAGSPKRPMGICATICFMMSSRMLFTISVAM